MIRANLLLASLFTLLGGWYLWLTTAAPDRWLPHDPGIMFVPRILASGLIFLSVLLILQQIVPRLPRPKESPTDRLDLRDWLRTFGLLALTIAYAILLPWFGFLVVSPLYLVTAMVVSGAGWRARTGVIAVGVTGVIYVSFVYFFRVTLPPLSLP